MTADDILAAASALPPSDMHRVIVRLTTAYHRRLRERRYAAATAQCGHVWEEWTTGQKNTYHHKRCVMCKKQVDWDSSD